MNLAVLTLDVDAARHIALALRRYREDLARRGYARPPGLVDLEAAALQVVRGGHGESWGATVPAVPDGGLDDREFLSAGEVAQVSGLSVSTVRRRIGDGSLPSRLVGRRRLIARADLDRLGSEGSSDA